MESFQLWPDHEQRPAARRSAPGVAHRLSERRSRCAAGCGGQSGRFPEGAGTGEFLGQSAAAAKRSLDLAVLQYREGIKDFTTVLVAQQALLTEQDNLAATLGTISSSLVGVYKALGGGWEIREGKDLIPPDIKETMDKRTDWGKLLAPATYNPPAAEEPKSLIRPPDW